MYGTSNFATNVFEITLHTSLSRHGQGQIAYNQHGFVSDRSTKTNLACITQLISKELDANKQIDTIYTDFFKAF